MQSGERVSWGRAFLQPVTYLGLGLGTFILAGLIYLVQKDEQDAYDAAARSGANLVRVFEGYLSRTFKSADNTLRVMRTSYQQDPEHFDIAAWVKNPDVQNDLTLQLTIIGADGNIIVSTVRAPMVSHNLSEREHFKAQVHATTDELFISKPFVVRTQNKLAILISRRITNADGSFGGIISAALDPLELQKFYNSLDLGSEGSASLVGFDGVIRARGGSVADYKNKIGTRIAPVGVLQHYQTAPTGVYWNYGGTVDSVRRLITYRVIEGYPLIALVGLSKTDIYRHTSQNARIYYGLGAVLFLVIGATIILGAVRERKLTDMSRSLVTTKTQLETAMAHLPHLPHGICVYGGDRRLIVANELYATMYGLTQEQTKPGTSLRDIFEACMAIGSMPKISEERIAQRMNRALSFSECLTESLGDGRTLAIDIAATPGGGWVAVHQDITKQKKSEAEITHLAHYDGLTSLANRVLFLRHVSNFTTRCRADGTAFAVHILDLDRFKEINDTLGHACGDQLLRIVAQRLLAVVGSSDTVARLGGDEFAILQPLNAAQGHTAPSLAEKILSVFSDSFTLNEHSVNIETSIGIALAPDNGDEAEQLLKNADLALYKAKSEGRNTYRTFKPEMEMEARARHAMHIDLRQAICANQFELHYQPIIEARTRQTCGVEALVRWRHPVRGLVPPDQFIPLAEETGLIVPLGEWVLRKACFDAAGWPEHLKVAVNLSSVQFRKSDLSSVVNNALSDSGLSPARLELEVTESVLLQNDEENIGILHQFRAQGISIALDDFGTGYSSLSYLQSFPFEKIKIDRSFVANLTTRSDCAAIVSAVTGLARSLDMETTAEGVETEEQVMLLRAAGCGQMQGYLFSKPVPNSELGFDKPAIVSTKNGTAAA